MRFIFSLRVNINQFIAQKFDTTHKSIFSLKLFYFSVYFYNFLTRDYATNQESFQINYWHFHSDIRGFEQNRNNSILDIFCQWLPLYIASSNNFIQVLLHADYRDIWEQNYSYFSVPRRYFKNLNKIYLDSYFLKTKLKIFILTFHQNFDLFSD